MSKTIRAVFENGLFRPTEPVSLPEGTVVDIPAPEAQPAPPPATPMNDALAKIYAILAERYSSGHTDTAQRHNEHQP
jgi:predicted DNA-binding antitoxin AbrB/MazE fold protein